MAVAVDPDVVQVLERRGAEYPNRERGAVRADTAGGHDHQVARRVLEIDDRAKGDVSAIRGKPVEQPRRNVGDQLDLGCVFEPIDEGLGVEVADGGDAEHLGRRPGQLSGS